MACFKPLDGYQILQPHVILKKHIVFKPPAKPCRLIKIPCGQCIGCRLDRSREWAIRCMHEASLYTANSFITLTYDDAHLPSDYGLHPEHFQKFLKRLRTRLDREHGTKIRFYHCGEYGDQTGRPHYHAILFGWDFSQDRKIWKTNHRGERLYNSDLLDQTWSHGHAVIGDVTFQSAAYVARYILKKRTGEIADEHYAWTNPITGEVHDRKPEYTTMSRKPGIGKDWWDKYKTDVTTGDFVVLNQKKMRPPRYYDKLLKLEDWSAFEYTKIAREQLASKHADNNTDQRLAVRETVQQARLNLLKRTAQ